MSLSPHSAPSRLSVRRIVLFAVGLAIVFAAFFFQRRQDARLREVREMLNANLHTGMTRAEVELFLSGRGIGHTYLPEAGDSENSIQNTAELAILRGKQGGSIVRTDYQIRFYFDNSGRLTSYSVVQVYTGP